MALAQALPPTSSPEAQARSLHRALQQKVGKPDLSELSTPLPAEKSAKIPSLTLADLLLDTERLGQAT